MHRPRYDDWTFPKGKLTDGEDELDAAVREVAEETGLRCTPEFHLAGSRYVDRQGRNKVVSYWAMRAEGGDFVAGDEVDEARWISVPVAAGLLSYDRDRAVLCSFLERSHTPHVLLVRHADAGDRGKWTGRDEDRPLSPRGRRQAAALVSTLAVYPITRVVSSPARRCTETVEPVAARRGLPVETDERLSEGTDRRELVPLLSAFGDTTVVCTHGDVVQEALRALENSGITLPEPPSLAKGSVWVLEVRNGDFTAADHVTPPA